MRFSKKREPTVVRTPAGVDAVLAGVRNAVQRAAIAAFGEFPIQNSRSYESSIAVFVMKAFVFPASLRARRLQRGRSRRKVVLRSRSAFAASSMEAGVTGELRAFELHAARAPHQVQLELCETPSSRRRTARRARR
jgi:hypothetical protein